ncbi:hypothetical protein BJY04DRAFT_179138, partial [Aspergillus karnatakaensis]|uniref:uncharacterized protein n=1 Tax=Aspergillus karnatakaensis TaxID=1810916 RepID=UPI003CCD8D38
MSRGYPAVPVRWLLTVGSRMSPEASLVFWIDVNWILNLNQVITLYVWILVLTRRNGVQLTKGICYIV